MNFEQGQRVKHYKGGLYTIIGLATHTETAEEMVVYQNDRDRNIWVRPLDVFYEEIEYKGKTVSRFKEV